MVLILGQRNDASTISVAEWLLYYDCNVVILYTDDKNFKIISMSLQERKFLIKVNGETINLYDVDTVWNRRRGISPDEFTKQYVSQNSHGAFFMEKNDNYHYYHILEESKAVINFIHYLIETEGVKVIGSYFYNDVNKLMVLDIAQKCGFRIPSTKIVTSKRDLETAYNEASGKLITKAICEGIYRPDVRDEYLYYSYVERISMTDIKKFPDSFYPSLIQEEIDKSLDLRVFILENEFFAMAIFSQDREDAIVDYRKNDHIKNPLHFVPFELPNNITKKISVLMSRLKLNTGSIDLILDKKGEYYFLEINPCGQFAMTSLPCNYILEKKIAQILCQQK